MKTIFTDLKDYKLYAWGDWRDKSGRVKKYSQDSFQELHITGSIGFYFFLKENFKRAISQWNTDLEVITEYEKEEGVSIHKGWFYFMVHRAYYFLKNGTKSSKYLELAKKEDLVTYGEKAKDFPAFSRTG